MSDVIFVRPNYLNISEVRKNEGHYLPLSLLYSSTLLDKEGYNVKIIDQVVDRDWEATLRRELASKPLYVGVTSMTGQQIGNGIKVSKIAKEYGIPVAWGGPHASLLPEVTLGNPSIDMVVIGEGEETSLELARTLEKGGSLKGVRGLAYKSGKTVRINPQRPFVDLNKLPNLPYHLINVKDYITNVYGTEGLVTFTTSRGCPFRCTFCYNLAFNRSIWRHMTAERTLEQINLLVDKYHVKGVLFFDDIFFVDLKRDEKILKGVKELGIVWGSSGGRVNLLSKLDNAFLRLIESSGCDHLQIGYETGSDRILQLMKKVITVSDSLHVNRKLSKLNVTQRCNILIGVPTETKDDLRKTVAFTLKLLGDNPHTVMSPFQIFIPLPGTELFDVAIEQGFKPPGTLEEWDKYTMNVSNIPWADKDMKSILEMLRFATYFMDRKTENFGSPVMRTMADLYRPVALHRIKNLDARMNVELRLVKYLREKKAF